MNPIDETTPIEVFPMNAGSVFREKEARGKVIEEKPLARGLGTPTDNSLIGQEKVKIIQWEKSIESHKEKIKEKLAQIKQAKQNIKDYEKIAARKNKQ